MSRPYTTVDKEQLLEVIGTASMMNSDFKKPKYIVPLVYTFYNAECKEIYIGSTETILDRMDWHSRKKYWEQVKFIGLRLYQSRQDMRIAELIHIFDKKPILNNDGKYMDGKVGIAFPIDGYFLEYCDGTEDTVFSKEELMSYLCSGEFYVHT